MKNRIIRLICTLAVLTAILIVQPFGSAAEAAVTLDASLFADKSDIITTWNASGTAANPGGSNQYILFGSYPQTAITNPGSDIVNATYGAADNTAIVYGNKYARVSGPSGYTYYRTDESIKWRILSNSNGQLLLMSERMIDAGKPYLYNGFSGMSGTLGQQSNSTWINSDLRKWLGGEAAKSAFSQVADAATLQADEYSYGYIDYLIGKYAASGFITNAFSTAEAGKIVPVTENYSYYSQTENGHYLRSDLSIADGRVTLLSGGFADALQGVEIANNSYGFSSSTETVGGITVLKQSPSRSLIKTDYANSINSSATALYTRTSYNDILGSTGGKSFIAGGTTVGVPVYDNNIGIAPVIRLETASVLFASAAGGSVTGAGLHELRGTSTGNLGVDQPGMMLRYGGYAGFALANADSVEYFNAPAGSRLVVAAQNGVRAYENVTSVSGTGAISLRSVGMQAGTYNYRAWLEMDGTGSSSGLLLASAASAGSFLADYSVTWTNDPGKYTIVNSSGGALSSPQRTNADGKFSFRVELDPSYNQARNISVYSNSVNITPSNGVYTISEVYANQSITVAIDVNLVNVDLQSGEGYRIKDAVSGLYLSNNPQVPFGGDLKLRVELQPGYDKSSEISVRANGVAMVPVDGVYTISNIRLATSISISGISLNTYTVTLPNNVGVTVLDISPASRVVSHGGAISFRLALAEGYRSDEYISVNATNGTLSGTFELGFTVSNITGDCVVTISGLNKSEYSITLPSGIGFRITDVNGNEIFGVHKVIYDDNFSFRIEYIGMYSQGKGAKIFVTVGGLELQMMHVSGVYTINNIRENKTIYLRELMLNSYTVSLIQGEGYSFSFLDPLDMIVAHGYNFSFRLDIETEYNRDKDYGVYANGIMIPSSGGGYYLIAGISENMTILVIGLDKNKYSITLPAENGFAFFDISHPAGLAESGSVYKFKIALSEEYNKDENITVRANGQLLIKDGNGSYNINNLIADQIITVTGLDINEYSVTLSPGTGFTFTDYGLPTVLYGENYSFRIRMDKDYSQKLNMQVLINNVAVLGDADGVYIILNIRSDKAVTVINLEINKYSISYNSDSSPNPVTVQVAANEATTIKNGDIFAKEGYVFTGWKDEAGVKYLAGAFLTPESDLKLFAVWEREKLTFIKLLADNLVLTVIAGVAIISLVLLLVITSVVIKKRKNA